MKEAIFWLLLIVLSFFFGVALLSGCAALSGRTGQDIITEPPTPGVQLWNAAKKSNWLVTLSILSVAGGVFAMMNGSVKLGVATIASGSVSMFLALAVARFALWMAVCGLIGSVFAVLFSILVRRKALVEIIKGVQEVRNDSCAVDTDSVTRTLDNNQSPVTKKIVGNIKNELRLKGEI